MHMHGAHTAPIYTAAYTLGHTHGRVCIVPESGARARVEPKGDFFLVPSPPPRSPDCSPHHLPPRRSIRHLPPLLLASDRCGCPLASDSEAFAFAAVESDKRYFVEFEFRAFRCNRQQFEVDNRKFVAWVACLGIGLGWAGSVVTDPDFDIAIVIVGIHE